MTEDRKKHSFSIVESDIGVVKIYLSTALSRVFSGKRDTVLFSRNWSVHQAVKRIEFCSHLTVSSSGETSRSSILGPGDLLNSKTGRCLFILVLDGSIPKSSSSEGLPSGHKRSQEYVEESLWIWMHLEERAHPPPYHHFKVAEKPRFLCCDGAGGWWYSREARQGVRRGGALSQFTQMDKHAIIVMVRNVCQWLSKVEGCTVGETHMFNARLCHCFLER